MSNVSIYEKNWINLVFEDKNQEYGAYQLRRENPKTTLLSLFYGTLLVGGFIASFVIFNLKSDIPFVNPTGIIDEPIRVTTFTIPETESEPIKSLPTEKTPKTPVEPTNLSNMVVAQTQQAVVDVPANDNLTTEQPSTDAGTGNGTPDGSGQSTTATVGTTSGGETIKDSYTSVELDKLPAFPGGMEKFYQYVGNNFDKPVHLNAGTMISVLVAFVIEKDGSMTDIKVIRNPGHGLDKEAIRVLKSLKTKWTPGIKNGNKVRTEYVLPIKVKID